MKHLMYAIDPAAWGWAVVVLLYTLFDFSWNSAVFGGLIGTATSFYRNGRSVGGSS